MPVKNKEQLIYEESNHVYFIIWNKAEHLKMAINQGRHNSLLNVYNQVSVKLKFSEMA